MRQIGYSLVDENGTEINFWGNISGQMVSAPTMIALPNGCQVHCPAIGVDYGGCRLVPRMLVDDDQGNSIIFTGEAVVVRRPETPPEIITQRQAQEMLQKAGVPVDQIDSMILEASKK